MTVKNPHPSEWIKKVDFDRIAEQQGTPFYFYNLESVKHRIQAVRYAFGDTLELFYAVKANPNQTLLHHIHHLIDGVDIASGGEFDLSIKAGISPASISFAGPGKTVKELQSALKHSLGFISVESFHELRVIESLVRDGFPKASILLRINPLHLTKEFAIKMGGKPSQFGIDEEEIAAAIEFIRSRPGTYDFKGIHIYAGTQCLSSQHLAQNLYSTLEVAERTEKDFGLACQVINIGGGFGVPYYEKQSELDLEETAALFKQAFHKYNEQVSNIKTRFILELGRYLVADAGIYVTRVIGEKISRGERFYILDGGMNHHLAASGNLGATIRKNYQTCNLSDSEATKTRCTLVGPLCTPMDLMAKDSLIETPKIGDLIGFLYSGGYGYSASPLLFLGHVLPKELIAADNQVEVAKASITVHYQA